MDGKAKVVAFQYLYLHRDGARWVTCDESEYKTALSMPGDYHTRALIPLTDHEAALAGLREALQHAQDRAEAWRAKFSSVETDKQILLTGLEALAGEWEAERSRLLKLAFELRANGDATSEDFVRSYKLEDKAEVLFESVHELRTLTNSAKGETK